ncbi:DUF2924 domain-containing protein [Aquamicrobium terrae]|uniref:DUF2924 domain-containing protein n=1 Tax=Aquamicrobium terrae TaxID=1324945 RepID=A0ABV2MYD0_9HYPH
MTDGVLARLAEIGTMDMAALQAMWRELNGTEPPRHNRKFLESRLAYRVQELKLGGLKPQTRARLKALADELDEKAGNKLRKGRVNDRLIAGTRLIREWQGIEHCVTVTAHGFDYQGRPYKSLSAIARAITGTRWNGPLFFGIRNHRTREE